MRCDDGGGTTSRFSDSPKSLPAGDAVLAEKITFNVQASKTASMGRPLDRRDVWGREKSAHSRRREGDQENGRIRQNGVRIKVRAGGWIRPARFVVFTESVFDASH